MEVRGGTVLRGEKGTTRGEWVMRVEHTVHMLPSSQSTDVRVAKHRGMIAAY